MTIEIRDAWELMAEIGRLTAGARGVTRHAFGEGDDLAIEKVRMAAARYEIPAWYDDFGNLHCYLAGKNASAGENIIGSHVDSVPSGGNYDGLMGVVAGLAILRQAKSHNVPLQRSLRLIAFRGEESPWFGKAYIGSQLALGRATINELGSMRRFDSGLTLTEHLHQLRLSNRKTKVLVPLKNEAIVSYLELHIEQGPVLLEAGIPIAVSTAIRGNIRFPQARCRGEYAHSSMTPRRHRKDCVLALSELALYLDEIWKNRLESIDESFVFTIGKVSTNTKEHAMTKVAGEIEFSLNFGSTSDKIMTDVRRDVMDRILLIEKERGVSFDLGKEEGTKATDLDANVNSLIMASSKKLGVACGSMPTGGHDAAMFSLSGIPSAVLLVRNRNGSHNPDESMEYDDFAVATSVAAETLYTAANGMSE